MILDHIRDLVEFEKFFNEHPLGAELYTFDFIKDNPNLFCFYDEENGNLDGYIVITADKNDRLYLSGAARRKNMRENINAIKMVCDAFPCDIYSETDKKPAKLVLLKAGFKKLHNNLYRRIRYGKIST